VGVFDGLSVDNVGDVDGLMLDALMVHLKVKELLQLD